MAAKYFVVPYRHAGQPCALVIRESQEPKLWQAIERETEAGTLPSDRVEYSAAIPVGSVEEAFLVTRDQAGVTDPDLYRVDANGGLQSIAYGDNGAGRQTNPGRQRNSHDAGASTDALVATLWHGVHAFERSARTKRGNDRRAALGTAQWELGQAWTHGQYAALSATDKAEVRVWLYELGMRVHELIADEQHPSLSEVENTNESAQQLSDFISKNRFDSRRAANPRGSRR